MTASEGGFRVRPLVVTNSKWKFLGIKKETSMPSTKLGASRLD